MTAAPTKAKQITVTFNKAVDTTKAVIAVNKGAAKPTIESTTFAADAKSAVIALGTKMSEGTYTVTVTGLTETPLTYDFKTENEKLTSFKLVSPNLVATATATTVAEIYYKGLNQYEEPMYVDAPTVSCTFGYADGTHGGVAPTAATADKSGKITVSDIVTTLAISGTTGTIVLVDKSGVNLNTTVTYQSKSFAAEANVYGVYSKKTEKVIEGNLTTGAKPSDYAILMSVKDQYGFEMTPAQIVASGYDVTYSPASVLTDLQLPTGYTKVNGAETELTYNGESAFLVPLADNTTLVGGTSNKIDKAGTLSLTIVSGGKGQIANPVITVDESKIIKSISITPASSVYADEENEMIVEAYDAAGEAITKYDDLKAARLAVTSTMEQNAGKLVLKKQPDGTAKLYFKPYNTFANQADNFKESTIATLVINANDNTSKDYIVKTQSVTVYEKAYPWAVAGKTKDTVTACAVSRTLSLDLKSLLFEDQYSNEVKAHDGRASASTNQIGIAIIDKYNTFGNNAGAGFGATTTAQNVTGSIVGNNLVLTSIGNKGDATLYFRYLNASLPNANDNGKASDSKYDFKLTISATSVSDTTASDLKLVVNNGNAVCVTGSDVELIASDVKDPDNHLKTASVVSASVYVTGVVNGKTVVIPSSQYHLVTKKLGKLGEYDPNDPDKPAKTETKTVTVVVDSESGAQELTADVTVSNKTPEITTVKAADNKGDIGTLGSGRKIVATDLIKAVKVLDQYGNEMTGQSAKFRYDVTLTGTSADWEKKTDVGNKTQDVEIEFAATTGTVNVGMSSSTKITATVVFTTLDGKVTFTQDVTCYPAS